jgi:hypothetical protein
MRANPASRFSVVVATMVGSLLLLLSVPNVVPAVRAARADGDPGTFVAEQVSCIGHLGHEACSWFGTFRPRGDSEVKADVYLYGSDVTRSGPDNRFPPWTPAGRPGSIRPMAPTNGCSLPGFSPEAASCLFR